MQTITPQGAIKTITQFIKLNPNADITIQLSDNRIYGIMCGSPYKEHSKLPQFIMWGEYDSNIAGCTTLEDNHNNIIKAIRDCIATINGNIIDITYNA